MRIMELIRTIAAVVSSLAAVICALHVLHLTR